jgi:steroid delta-isomerase-like uncharacterized protein
MPARHVLTILAVADAERAASFYSQVFAWPLAVHVPVYREFELPQGQRLGLYQREAFARNTGALPAQVEALGITATELYLHVDDVAAAATRALAAGARLLSAQALRPWGDDAAYVADPDGNVVVVARPLTEAASAPGGPLTGAALRALARRWLALWNDERPDVFDELHAVNFVDHAPAGRATTRQAFAAGITELRAAFPDLRVAEEDLVVDVDAQKLTVRWSGAGHHRAAFLGVPATGRQITFHGIELLQVAGGVIAERWGEWDAAALVAQLRQG